MTTQSLQEAGIAFLEHVNWAGECHGDNCEEGMKFRAALEADRAPEEGLRFAEFARVNRARCEAPDGFGHPLSGWTLSDWLLAATGEFGEAANVAKKLNRERDGIPGNTKSGPELRADLADEFADAVIYLDLAAQSQGIDLGSAIASKFNRTSEKIGAPHRLAAKTSGSPDPQAGSGLDERVWAERMIARWSPDEISDRIEARAREIAGPIHRVGAIPARAWRQAVAEFLAATQDHGSGLDMLAREDAPYFRRLNPILRALGFQVAAYLTPHQNHVLDGSLHSDCDECLAAPSPSTPRDSE